MWGVEFVEASNDILCGSAWFRVARLDGTDHYRLLMHPDHLGGLKVLKRIDTGLPAIDDKLDSSRIYLEDDNRWRDCGIHSCQEFVDQILPRQDDCRLQWTWRDFLIAMTAFAEGCEVARKHADVERERLIQRIQRFSRRLESHAAHPAP